VSIKDKTDMERQNIEVGKKDNGLYQQWDVIYVDEMPADPKKGELNKRFNMHVDRPFFVVSGLKSERYLDIIKHNVVLKTPNGFPS
jgi:peroxiredoxin